MNTFGASSVGAALYYDVYVDGVLKTTISYAAPTAPASTTTVNVTAGTHTWYVIARNMFGSGTKSSTFTFTAGRIITRLVHKRLPCQWNHSKYPARHL